MRSWRRLKWCIRLRPWYRCGLLEVLLLVTVIFFMLQTKLILSRYQDDPLQVEDIGSLPALVPQIKPICKSYTKMPQNMDWILHQMDEQEWAWILKRVQNQMPMWKEQLSSLSRTLFGYVQLRILVVPGLLIGTDFARNSSIKAGGPLGDLVQWADLILALHLLGHNVTLTKDIYQVARGIRYDHLKQTIHQGCPAVDFDVIYTDIITLKNIPKDALRKASCRWRVLDAYGTEPAYNDAVYSLTHGLTSQYGQLAIHPKQFQTFYPHSPDNSFLGFTVPPIRSELPEKQNIGLLYGKDPAYFENATLFIKELMEYMDVHSTLYNQTVLPQGVYNHGILSQAKYRDLLSKSKYFIGVGLPLESTGVLEALANGCIVLNPAFSGYQLDILQRLGKPTSRKMTSQVPFLETIHTPNVFTIANISQLKMYFENMQPTQVNPFIPPQFTIPAFIKRVSRQLHRQQFCPQDQLVTREVLQRRKHGQFDLLYDLKHKENVWPPLDLLVEVEGKFGQTCIEACVVKNLTCESVYFPFLKPAKRWSECEKTKDTSIYYPAVTGSGRCLLQARPTLYSCAGGQQQLARLCPCRLWHEQYDV